MAQGNRSVVRGGLIAGAVVVVALGTWVATGMAGARHPAARPAPAPTASLVPPASPATTTTTTAGDAARDASWREARAAAIRVQQRLRAQQQALKSAQARAAQRERCVAGQRIKRVANGWVQAGRC